MVTYIEIKSSMVPGDSGGVPTSPGQHVDAEVSHPVGSEEVQVGFLSRAARTNLVLSCYDLREWP
jgi:hypothetical protein